MNDSAPADRLSIETPGRAEASHGLDDQQPIVVAQSRRWIRSLLVILAVLTVPVVVFIAVVEVLTFLDHPATRPSPGVAHEPMGVGQGLVLVGLTVVALLVVFGPLIAAVVRRRRGIPQLLADAESVRFGSGPSIPWDQVGSVTPVTGRFFPAFEVSYRKRSTRPSLYGYRKIRGDQSEEFRVLNRRLRVRWQLVGDTSDPAGYVEKSHGNGRGSWGA